jgi:threonine dehydrogenase-like Zn-dependent dehydrogenase
MIPCNRCRRCKEGNTQLCLNYDQIGFTRPGGYGEFVRVPRHVVHRLPDSVSFAAGTLVEPAACVLRGLERGRPRPGDTIGVIGVGTLGSLAVTLARLYSPGALVAYGVREEELTFARALGADATAHVAEQDPAAATHELLGGGLDLVIETAGASAAVDLATRLVRPGGRVVLLGIAGEGKTLEIPADRIMFADMDVVGSCSYPTSAWSSVVRLLEHGLLDLDQIVTHRFPTDRFEEAFALMDNRQGVVAKVVLEHQNG